MQIEPLTKTEAPAKPPLKGPPPPRPRRSIPRVAVNAASNVLVRGADVLSNFLISAILVRYLTQAQTGVFFYLMSIINIIMPLVDLGASQLAVREAVWSRERASHIFGSMVSLRLILGSVVLPIAVLVGFILHMPSDEMSAYALGLLAMMIVDQSFLGPARAALLAYERLNWDAFIAVVGIAIRVVGLFAVIHLDWHLPGVFLALLAASLIRAVVAMALVKSVCVPIRVNFDRAEMKILALKSIPMGAVMYMVALRGNVGTVITRRLAGPEATAYFALPQKIMGIAVMGGSAILFALYPRICAAMADSPEGTRRAMNMMFIITMLIYGPVFLVLAIPSTQVMSLLYGQNFAIAGPSLAIMAITPVFNLIDLLQGFVFIAMNRIWSYFAVMAITCASSFIASLVLIPRMGFRGAAWGIVISSFVSIVVANHLQTRTLGGPLLWNALLWPGICLAAASGCALLIPNRWVAAAAGIVVFSLLAFLLRRRMGLDFQALKALTFRPRGGDPAAGGTDAAARAAPPFPDAG